MGGGNHLLNSNQSIKSVSLPPSRSRKGRPIFFGGGAVRGSCGFEVWHCGKVASSGWGKGGGVARHHVASPPVVANTPTYSHSCFENCVIPLWQNGKWFHKKWVDGLQSSSVRDRVHKRATRPPWECQTRTPSCQACRTRKASLIFCIPRSMLPHPLSIPAIESRFSALSAPSPM